MSATLHTLRRVGKPLWGPRTGTTWFWIEGFIGTQPLADVLSLPVFLLQQQRWVVATKTAHKAYNISYLNLCKKEKFADSWPKETEIHMAPWWKDHASQSEEKSRAVRGEGGAQRRCWEEGVGEAGGQHGERCWPARLPEREVRPQKTAHPILKLFPEIYRPECKSWYASNSSWNFSSALYARIVQSPWREDAKWENTRLRAGKAETDTRQRKSGRLDARKPTASRPLWSHVLLKGILHVTLNSCSHQASL